MSNRSQLAAPDCSNRQATVSPSKMALSETFFNNISHVFAGVGGDADVEDM